MAGVCRRRSPLDFDGTKKGGIMFEKYVFSERQNGAR